MKRFNHLPITHKLVAIMMIATITAVSLMAIAVVSNEMRQQRAFIYLKRSEQLSALAAVLGSRSTAALAFNDPDTAKENLDALRMLKAHNNIVFAGIYDHAEQLFAEYETTHQDRGSNHATFSVHCHGENVFGNFLSICEPILLNGERLGEVRLVFDMRSDLLSLRASLGQFAMVMFLVVLATFLATFVLSSRLQKLISTPILRLREAMKIVSEQKDYSVRVAETSQDELGVLITGFNDMLAQIEARDAKLARYSTELEEEVAARTIALEEANERRIVWLENLARFLKHELKNAMVGIKSSLDLMQRRSPTDGILNYIERAKTSLGDMEKLLERVGKASTLEAAFYREPKQPVDLSALVQAKVQQLCDIYPHQPVEYQGEDSVSIMGSEVSLMQMLNNLISNAMDYCKVGSPIVISLKRRDRQAVLSVANEGAPLPEDKERIFELFISIRDTTRQGKENTGLGLHLVRLIAEYHGGNVTAADLPGRSGALFTVTLPLN